ncbi:hypothetical protein B0H34DRAFT_546176 [Crassisporium funariophilum]|nr:hypothetical protein B0H34DRAFT_546176 [Crassisporium funariophilum]
MAKAKPCYCPNCKGQIRAATTVNRHVAKAAKIEAENLARQVARERGREEEDGNDGGYEGDSNDGGYEGDSEEDFVGSQEEEAQERPWKRRRTEARDLAPGFGGLQDETDLVNQYRLEDEGNETDTSDHEEPLPLVSHLNQKYLVKYLMY